MKCGFCRCAKAASHPQVIWRDPRRQRRRDALDADILLGQAREDLAQHCRLQRRDGHHHVCRIDQPWRRILVSTDSDQAGYLLNLLPLACHSIKSAKRLTDEMSRISRKIWPELKPAVTPYTFRHAFSAEAKAALPPEQVAAALGHVSVKTQRHYGTRRQARGKFSPLAATAGRAITHLDKVLVAAVEAAPEPESVSPFAWATDEG